MLAAHQKLLVIRYLALAPMVQVEVTEVASILLQATQHPAVTTVRLREQPMAHLTSGRHFILVAAARVVGVTAVVPVVVRFLSMQILSRTSVRYRPWARELPSAGKVVKEAVEQFTSTS